MKKGFNIISHAENSGPQGFSILAFFSAVMPRGFYSASQPCKKWLRARNPAGCRIFRDDLIIIKRPNNGFTLIELLVVVLIIGILSAVALPQYEKAVEKSRASEALLILKSLRDAQAVCFMENGTDSGVCMQSSDPSRENIFSTISIQIPNTATPMCDYGTTAGPATKNFEYWADGEFIVAIRRPCDKYRLETTGLYDYKVRCCNEDDDGDKNWCKIIGFTKQEGYGWVQP